MESVSTEPLEITSKTRCIVCFGPPSAITGYRAGEYYQVVVDPEMQSPEGNYIRFDAAMNSNEIHGWQRVAAITICEVLEKFDGESKESVTMRAIVKE